MNAHLTNLQHQTMRAAIDRIIPPDEFPGAWEAGVGDYLLRQFERDLTDRFEFYCSGLDGLEAEAITRFERSFPALDACQQDQILADVENENVLTRWSVRPDEFFELLVRTTAEGYYSDPQQGGNRRAISWAMVGFEESETA